VHGFRIGSDVWLVELIQFTISDRSEFLVGIYGLFAAGIFFGVLYRGWFFSVIWLKKSVSLHDRCLKTLLRAPVSLIESLGPGMILSNFTKHLFLIESKLPDGFLINSNNRLALDSLIHAFGPWIYPFSRDCCPMVLGDATLLFRIDLVIDKQVLVCRGKIKGA
jgi:hypothetical protein